MSREILKELYFQAINNSVDKQLFKKELESFKDAVFIFAVGKAAGSMCEFCEEILKENIKGGLCISSKKEKLKYIKTFQSSHPIVSKKSIKAAKLLIENIEKLNKDDKFIFLLSGGASAMVELPIDGLKFNDFQKVSKVLIGSGIDIKALNSVRKSISKIKGAKLSNFFKTTKGKVLVLSDVVGDDLSTIGSALMYPSQYSHTIVGSNKIALKYAKKFTTHKYHFQKTKIVTTTLDKTSKETTSFILKTIEEYDKNYDSFCLFFGGETTTEVLGSGIGGRNQELALRLLIENNFSKNISILCAGSDGKDGNSDFTGAFIDMNIYEKIKKLNLNPKKYLENSDSSSFFKKLGYEFNTGLTGINVMDFIFVIKNKL